MARIRSLEQGEQSIGVHRTDVDCAYQAITTPEGELLLHLASFGSDERQSGKKASQQLQLDREMAEQLVQVINRTFAR